MKQLYKPTVIGPDLPIGSKRRPGRSPGFLNLLPTKWQAKAFLSLLCVLFTAHAFAVDYYAAPAPLGTAANNGLSQTTPKTLAAAAIVAGPGDRVLLMPGTYRETAQIRKDGAIYMPLNGPGSVTINGADLMLTWTPASGSTYSTAMSWDLNTITSPRKWGSNQLFEDGSMIELARWPKRPVNSTDADLVLMPYNASADNVIVPNPGSNINNTQITITDNDFNGDARWIGAKIWVNNSRAGSDMDGQGSTGTVTAISGNTITATIPGAIRGAPSQPWGVGPKTEYFLFDPAPAALADAAAIDALLAPGEWWRNNTTSTLYVKTRNGAAPASSATATSNVIEAKRRHFGFLPDANSRSGYTIQDLSLFACAITTDQNASTDRIISASNIMLQRLTVKYPSHITDFAGDWNSAHTGWTGMIISGKNVTLQDCDISLSAASAVSFQGVNCKMLRNRIYDVNYLCSSSGAVNTGFYCIDSEIGYNTLFNTTHAGISYRGLFNSNRAVKHQARIHHNTIYDFMMRSYDSGAIDAAVKDGQWLRIDHNKIFNTRPEARIGGRKYGIYSDYGQQASQDFNRVGLTVDHNVIYDVNNPATLNAGWDIHVFNNVFLTVDQSLTTNPEGSRGLTVGMDIGGALAGNNVRVHNNIISDPPPLRYKTPPTYVFNNITDAKGAVLEELFVDATNPNLAARNYQLKPTATRAIDKGISVAEYTDNYPLDRPIVGITDIGAFEHPTSSIASDTERPSIPDSSGFVVANKNGNSFLFSWAPSTDNVGVAYYEVYANGTLLTQVPATSLPSFQVTKLEGSTSYFMKVLAVDGSGNRSELSKTLEVKTSAPVPNVSIQKAAAAIVIDGDKDAAYGNNSLPLNIVFDTPLDPANPAADLSATWTSLWDETNMSFFIDVKDDVKKVDSNGDWYFDDHIEIMIDADGTQPTKYGTKQHQYYLVRGAGSLLEFKNGTSGNSVAGAQVIQKEVPGGYQVEVKIPFLALGVTAQALNVMGIEVQVGDDDDGGREDTRIGWFSTTNNPSNNPSVFGVAVLTANGIENDTAPPTAPTGLTSSVIFPSQFTLNWTASSDNLAVNSYEVFVNGNLVGTPKLTTFTVTGLTEGTTYSVQVRAKDRFYNLSPMSSVLKVITPTKASAVKYESENAVIVGGSKATTVTGYSGTGYVQGIDVNNFSAPVKNITYTVNVSQAGTYAAFLQYSGRGVLGLYINGSKVANVDFQNTIYPNAWGSEYGLMSLPNLQAGDNAVKLAFEGSANGNSNGPLQDYLGVFVPTSSFKGPIAPTTLNATGITDNGFTLNWAASAGNTVTGYDVYRDGILVGSTADSSLTIASLEPGTTYDMTVKGKTSQGNQSDASTVLTVLTTGTGSKLITGIVVTPDVNDLLAGQAVQLYANIAPTNANNKLITWTSSSNNIASVDNTGKVTANNVGTAIITATSRDGSQKKGSVQINVSRPWIKIDDNALNSGIIYDSNWRAYTGNGGYLNTEHYMNDPKLLSEATFTFTGTRGRYYGFERYDLGYGDIYLDGVKVATVDQFGNNGNTVKDKMLYDSGEMPYGTHTITVKGTNTSNPNPLNKARTGLIIDAFEYSPYIVQNNAVAGVTVTPSSATVAEGSQVTLNASVSPAAANQNVSWSSLNPAIASVTNGIVNGLQAGTATIRAASVEDNTKFSDVTITVTALPVPVISAGGVLSFCPGESVVLTSTEAPAYQWYKGADALSGQTSRSLTASQSGDYTVEVTYAGGAKRTSVATTVNATDAVKPEALAKNITVALVNGSAVITAADVDNGSTDNCGIASLALDKTTFGCADAGAQTVTLTATDKSGNTATATATVTVEEKVKPVVITKNITVQLDASGTATISDDAVNNGSTDNCSSAESLLFSTDIKSFSCANVGTPVSVTLTVTDASGNSNTETALVTVEDQLKPVVVTRNISVALVNGSAVITAADVDNGSTDNCGIASLELNKTSFSCSDIGNQTVTLKVTDKSGNTSSATATVTVTGSIPAPSIAVSRTDNTYTGLDPKTIALGYGAQSLTLTASNNTSASNTYSWSPAAGLSNAGSANPVFTPTSAGTYTFTVNVTNEIGCQASTSVTIKVIDVRCGNKNNKVLICKKAGSDKAKEGCIGVEDVASALTNGAKLGGCTTSIIASTGAERGALDVTSLDASSSVRLTSYPNPFANQTTVSFTLPQAEQKVTLAIFNAVGTRIATLYSGKAEANVKNEIVFDSSSLPAGAYFARLITSTGSQTFKLIVAK